MAACSICAHLTPDVWWGDILGEARDDATVYSRMFGPCIGIPEDPATGAASGPLGAYLLQHNAVSADNASRRPGATIRRMLALFSGALLAVSCDCQ
jgi:PhzF family phenazine biosynthesis protein